MFQLISEAIAQDVAAPIQANPSRALLDMLPILAVFIIFFFLMVRPRLKEEKKRKEMLSQLKRGDDVMTMSGIHGKIVELGDSTVSLQIANGVNVKMERQAIQSKVAS